MRIRTVEGSYRYPLVNNLTQREWLVMMNPGDVVETRRLGIGAYISDGGNVIHRFTVGPGEGGSKISVDAVERITVQAPNDTVPAGTPVTFTAATFSKDATITDWYLVKGASSERQDHCWKQPTCAITLSSLKDGAHVNVTGKWGGFGHGISGNSKPVKVVQDKLVLRCANARSVHLGPTAVTDSVPVGISLPCHAESEYGAPVTVQSWTFAPDNPAHSQSPPSQAINPWNVQALGCGLVSVTATVAGVQSPQSVSVRLLVGCNLFAGGPTGDSFLDDPKIQRAMRDLWNSSYSDVRSNRLEKGFIVVRSGGELFVRPYRGESTRCTSHMGEPIEVYPGEEFVAFVHTHPDNGGEPMPSDGTCHKNTALGADFGNGPGRRDDRDRSLARRLAAMYEPDPAGYIIDKDEIHRFSHKDLPDAAINRNPNCP